MKRKQITYMLIFLLMLSASLAAKTFVTDIFIISNGNASTNTTYQYNNSYWNLTGTNLFPIGDYNIGIGTTTPNSKLHVNSSSHANITLETTGAFSNSYLSLKNPTQEWRLQNSGALLESFRLYDYTENTYPLIVQSGTPSSTLLLNDSGYVGVNTDEIKSELTVNGDVSWGATKTYDYNLKSGGSTLAGYGSTSALFITVQDGSGRSNFYWNARYNQSTLKHHCIVGGGEYAVNFEIGNGYFQVMVSEDACTNPGDNISWIQGYSIDKGGNAQYLKQSLNLSMVFLNRVNNGNAVLYTDSYSNTGGNKAIFDFRKARGTQDNLQAVDNGDDFMGLYGYGYDGNSWENIAQIYGEVDGVVSDEIVPSRILIKLQDLSGTLKQVMVIRQDGSIDFGNDISPDAHVEINGFNGNGYICATNTSDCDTFLVDENGYVGIGQTAPTHPLEVFGNTSGVSIWSEGNISASGYLTRTSVYDKSKGSALNYIKDSNDYMKDGKIDHTKFYGYAGLDYIADKSRPVYYNTTEEVCGANETEEICHNVTEQHTEYPYKIALEQVSIDAEIDMLRQAVFELKKKVEELEATTCNPETQGILWDWIYP